MPSLPIPESLRPRNPRRRAAKRVAMPWIPDVDRSTAIIDCAVYRDGVRQPGSPTWQEAIDDVEAAGTGFMWVGLHEPSERQLSGIADRLHLHPLAVEDAVHAHQRPKLERYGDSLFCVVKTVHYNDDGKQVTQVVETGELMVFLGTNFVVTVRHGEHGGLHRLRQGLESHHDLLRHGPAMVLHAIVDRAVDDYLAVGKELQDDVDEVESAVFAGINRSAETNRIYLLKREVVELRRAVVPLAEPLKVLATSTMGCIPPDVRTYFRDVEDHISQVVERVSSFDELLTTLVTANLAQLGVMQNEDMRKISAWVAIISVPTMVAGIYGMNFKHMPELHWTYSYPTVLALVLVACFFLHRAFKRNGWL
ncbi:MAG: magnesium/cobalt transporter CorA [Jatrophihabitans sp.]